MANKANRLEHFSSLESKLNRILKEQFHADLKKADSVQKGEAFTIYYVYECLKDYYGLENEEEIEVGLSVSGPNDLEVDFIYEGEDFFLISQTKWRNFSNKGQVKDSEIEHFSKLYTDTIFEKESIHKANRRLRDYIENIQKDKDKKLILDFTTSTSFSRIQKSLIEKEIENCLAFAKSRNYPSPIIVFNDIDDLIEIYENKGEEFRKKTPFTIYLKEYKDLALEKKLGRKDLVAFAWFDMKDILETKSRTIVIVIDGTQLISMYRNNGRNLLFNNNIRLYQGKSSAINRKIIKTIEDEPNKFFTYNNGISAICTSLDISSEKINISGLQVINGAQTVASIWEVRHSVHPDVLKKLMVLMRITETTDEQYRNRITQFNNSQNAISAADFRSNDKIQLWLRDEIQKYSYFGNDDKKVRKFKYHNKRQVVNNQFKTVKLIDFTKTLAAIQLGPNYATSALSKLFDDSSNGYYYKIYGDNGISRDSFPSIRFKRSLAAVIILFRIDHLRKIARKQIIKNGKKDTIEDFASQARFHLLWSYFMLINKFHKEKEEEIFDSLMDGMTIGEKSFIDIWFPRILKTIRTTMRANSVDGEINHKNWIRSDKNREALEDYLNDELEADYQLPLLS